MSDLETLEAKLVVATGPGRELDNDIAYATGNGDPRDGQPLDLARNTGLWYPKRYTSSVDAALTLVPEGWTPFMESNLDDGLRWFFGLGHDTYDAVDSVRLPYAQRYASLSLAICLAAIRARRAAEPAS